MVKLILSDLNQITFLEQTLMQSNIEYIREIETEKCGLVPPYLRVYGAALDEARAFKWIAEQK